MCYVTNEERFTTITDKSFNPDKYKWSCYGELEFIEDYLIPACCFREEMKSWGRLYTQQVNLINTLWQKGRVINVKCRRSGATTALVLHMLSRVILHGDRFTYVVPNSGLKKYVADFVWSILTHIDGVNHTGVKMEDGVEFNLIEGFTPSAIKRVISVISPEDIKCGYGVHSNIIFDEYAFSEGMDGKFFDKITNGAKSVAVVSTPGYTGDYSHFYHLCSENGDAYYKVITSWEDCENLNFDGVSIDFGGRVSGRYVKDMRSLLNKTSFDAECLAVLPNPYEETCERKEELCRNPYYEQPQVDGCKTNETESWGSTKPVDDSENLRYVFSIDTSGVDSEDVKRYVEKRGDELCGFMGGKVKGKVLLRPNRNGQNRLTIINTRTGDMKGTEI